jgi:hypothetical protein
MRKGARCLTLSTRRRFRQDTAARPPPSKWPWTYFILLLSFALHHYGRRLALDLNIVSGLRQRPTLGRISLAEES